VSVREIGFSIPATEHSTITSWGRDRENEAYGHMLTQFGKPAAIFAVVSDSYNIYEACKMWVKRKAEVIASGATLVIRPDSGDPVQVLSALVSILGEGFGFTLNDKGYKVLNNVRLIWGDGINVDTIRAVYSILVDQLGWSADNFAFGMGGALLQAPQRDDYGWAMKASAAFIEGEWTAVFKDPIDAKNKASKRGRVTLFRDAIGYYSGVPSDSGLPLDEMADRFHNGKQHNLVTFQQVRANSNK
jgi:nicotinamide phosphoribosyltransferase